MFERYSLRYPERFYVDIRGMRLIEELTNQLHILRIMDFAHETFSLLRVVTSLA